MLDLVEGVLVEFCERGAQSQRDTYTSKMALVVGRADAGRLRRNEKYRFKMAADKLRKAKFLAERRAGYRASMSAETSAAREIRLANNRIRDRQRIRDWRRKGHSL
jgi:hypothetical protein